MVVRGGVCHIINVRKSPYDIITAMSLRSKYYKKGLNHFVFNFLKNDPKSDLFFFFFFFSHETRWESTTATQVNKWELTQKDTLSGIS